VRESRVPFDHEKLDVYQVAMEFVARANDIVEQLPRGRGYLGDQLQRAASSIVLNVAEGAGKFSPADKAVFYTRARASATECAAVLDVCRKLNLITDTDTHKAMLERISQMLTKLIKSRRPL
jgi:four helix bundle protein